jgi:hypothetical protein
MSKVDHLNKASVLANLVINHNGAMQELANAWPFSSWNPHVRESTEQLNVSQQRMAEAFCSFLIVFRDVFDNFLEIF